MKKAFIFFKDILFYIILIFYIFILAEILLFKYVSPLDIFSDNRMFTRSLNLIPLTLTLEYFFGSFSLKVALMNVAGNIAIFIPMGIYLNLFKKNKSMIQSVGIVLLISLCVEITQYVFQIGGSDIDDIILNTLGGFIGILIFRIITSFFKDEAKAKMAITTGSCILGTLCLFLILTYYPQMLMIERKPEFIIAGKEFAVDDSNPDVIGKFISFNNGILTVRNGTGMSIAQNQYGDVEVSVEVDKDTKIAKKAIDYHYGPNEILITYENFAYEEFESLGNDDAVGFNIIIEEGKLKAKNICVFYKEYIND